MILPVTQFMLHTHKEGYGIFGILLAAIIHKTLHFNNS